jgi:hypothetical protein
VKLRLFIFTTTATRDEDNPSALPCRVKCAHQHPLVTPPSLPFPSLSPSHNPTQPQSSVRPSVRPTMSSSWPGASSIEPPSQSSRPPRTRTHGKRRTQCNPGFHALKLPTREAPVVHTVAVVGGSRWWCRTKDPGPDFANSTLCTKPDKAILENYSRHFAHLLLAHACESCVSRSQFETQGQLRFQPGQVPLLARAR